MPHSGLVRFANSTEKARLAIVPGYSHYNFVSATELAAIIDKYLADPLTNARRRGSRLPGSARTDQVN